MQKLSNKKPCTLRSIKDKFGYLSVFYCTCGNFHIVRFKNHKSKNISILDTLRTKRSSFNVFNDNIDKKWSK